MCKPLCLTEYRVFIYGKNLIIISPKAITCSKNWFTAIDSRVTGAKGRRDNPAQMSPRAYANK